MPYSISFSMQQMSPALQGTNEPALLGSQLRPMAQSFGKCFLLDPHFNLGWQGTIIDKDMVSWKW